MFNRRRRLLREHCRGVFIVIGDSMAGSVFVHGTYVNVSKCRGLPSVGDVVLIKANPDWFGLDSDESGAFYIVKRVVQRRRVSFIITSLLFYSLFVVLLIIYRLLLVYISENFRCRR